MRLLYRVIIICLGFGIAGNAVVAQDTGQTPQPSKIDSRQAETDGSYYPSLFDCGDGTRPLDGTKGVTAFLNYRGDHLTNVAGGLEQKGAYLHNVDVLLGINADALIQWSGARFLVHVISNNGGSFNSYVGASQQVSNIAAPKTTKLYQAWLQQDFMCGRLSFLAGLYDFNTEFYITRTSAIFLNNSFFVGKELSQAGSNGSGIFPNSAAAFRMRFRPASRWSFQFVALDGVPGESQDRSRPSLRMSMNEGAFIAGEVAYNWHGIDAEGIGKGKYTLGSWVHTSPVRRLTVYSDQEPRSERNYGFYFLAEQQVCAESDDDGQGLGLFMRVGLANGNVNQYDFNVSGGLVYTGLIRGRETDKLGFAATHANNSLAYKSAARMAGNLFASAELALEITYVAQLTSWLSIQPDIQHVIHPATNPELEAATVLGSRLRVGLD